MPTYQGVVPDFAAINGDNREEILGKSHYYWWFLMLRENRDYRRYGAEGVKYDHRYGIWKDFGDVINVEFEEWWKEKGEYLFADNGTFTGVFRLCGPEDWKPEYKEYPVLVLAFDCSQGVSAIRKDIEGYLRKLGDGGPGRPRKGAKGFTARYPITGVVQLHKIKTLVRLLQLHRSMYGEIGRSLGVDDAIVLGRKAGVRLIERGQIRPSGNPFDDAEYREKFARRVQSLIRDADHLCYVVSAGFFPVARGSSLRSESEHQRKWRGDEHTVVASRNKATSTASSAKKIRAPLANNRLGGDGPK